MLYLFLKMLCYCSLLKCLTLLKVKTKKLRPKKEENRKMTSRGKVGHLNERLWKQWQTAYHIQGQTQTCQPAGWAERMAVISWSVFAAAWMNSCLFRWQEDFLKPSDIKEPSWSAEEASLFTSPENYVKYNYINPWDLEFGAWWQAMRNAIFIRFATMCRIAQRCYFKDNLACYFKKNKSLLFLKNSPSLQTLFIYLFFI